MSTPTPADSPGPQDPEATEPSEPYDGDAVPEDDDDS